MTIRTFGFASVLNDRGTIAVRFAASKTGMSFGSLAQLKAAIRDARERDRMHRMLLAIGQYLQADATLADTKALESVTFTADDGA